MDTKGLQKEFINWCKSKNKQPKSEDETKQLFVAFMKEKHPEEYKQAVENQQKQQATKALHGAKLNYFKSLKHQCAEDEEVVYYKKGGSVTCGCKKKEEGGEIPTAKCGAVTKFKKRKMNTGGNFLTNILFTAAGMQRGYEKATEKPKTKPKKKPMFQGKEQDIVGKTLERGSENSGPKAKGPVDGALADNKGLGKNECGGKVKKKAGGSKINKNCGGSSIVSQFKKHFWGGKLGLKK